MAEHTAERSIMDQNIRILIWRGDSPQRPRLTLTDGSRAKRILITHLAVRQVSECKHIAGRSCLSDGMGTAHSRALAPLLSHTPNRPLLYSRCSLASFSRNIGISRRRSARHEHSTVMCASSVPVQTKSGVRVREWGRSSGRAVLHSYLRAGARV